MKEFRCVKANEIEEFLRLLCSVFDLDFNLAKPVFSSEPFFDLDRKWICAENGKIIACATTVPIRFESISGIGIAGVATDKEYRGKGIGTELLNALLEKESHALLFAKETNIYSRIGFDVLDEVQPILIDGGVSLKEPIKVKTDYVKLIYDDWSAKNPTRLHRDKQRWEYWEWNMKSTYENGGGYLAVELGRTRELLPNFEEIPFSDSLEWYGLKTMAEKLAIRGKKLDADLFLMGKGFNFVPEMFLTDQF